MVGVPYNIASYALLLMMIAKEVGMYPHYLEITFGDAHIYKNHFDGYNEQISRKPALLPRLEIVDTSLDVSEVKNNVGGSKINLYDYDPATAIPLPIAV